MQPQPRATLPSTHVRGWLSTGCPSPWRPALPSLFPVHVLPNPDLAAGGNGPHPEPAPAPQGTRQDPDPQPGTPSLWAQRALRPQAVVTCPQAGAGPPLHVPLNHGQKMHRPGRGCENRAALWGPRSHSARPSPEPAAGTALAPLNPPPLATGQEGLAEAGLGAQGRQTRVLATLPRGGGGAVSSAALPLSEPPPLQQQQRTMEDQARGLALPWLRGPGCGV